MEAMYLTPNGATADTAVGNLPTLPIPVNYPQYNSLALLPLEPPNYEARVGAPQPTVTGFDLKIK